MSPKQCNKKAGREQTEVKPGQTEASVPPLYIKAVHVLDHKWAKTDVLLIQYQNPASFSFLAKL